MIDPEADRRIDRLEKELARIQSDETAYVQIEANLQRDNLRRTLTTAETMALAARRLIEGLTFNLDASLKRMADDLNGKERG